MQRDEGRRKQGEKARGEMRGSAESFEKGSSLETRVTRALTQ